MRYTCVKRDANHAAIVNALRAIGCSVLDLSAVGNGCPDILAGLGSRNWLIEIKSPGVAGKKRGANQAATNARQANFREYWHGQVATVSSVDEAFKVVIS